MISSLGTRFRFHTNYDINNGMNISQASTYCEMFMPSVFCGMGYWRCNSSVNTPRGTILGADGICWLIVETGAYNTIDIYTDFVNSILYINLK